MKTSLGIWAFGPMITRFVPGGYQPEHGYAPEPVAEKVHRAVQGLGELIDGYEFHYPDELSHENLDDVRAALGGTTSIASPVGCTSIRASAVAGWSTPTSAFARKPGGSCAKRPSLRVRSAPT